jgi:hypothetical protein
LRDDSCIKFDEFRERPGVDKVVIQ